MRPFTTLLLTLLTPTALGLAVPSPKNAAEGKFTPLISHLNSVHHVYKPMLTPPPPSSPQHRRHRRG
jgi:hypothetical protein